MYIYKRLRVGKIVLISSIHAASEKEMNGKAIINGEMCQAETLKHAKQKDREARSARYN
jgi:hypothetical protein